MQQLLWITPHTACLSPSPSPSLPDCQPGRVSLARISIWSFISPIWCRPTQLHAHMLINKARVSLLGDPERRAESAQMHVVLVMFLFFFRISGKSSVAFFTIHPVSLTHWSKWNSGVYRLWGTCTPTARWMCTHTCTNKQVHREYWIVVAGVFFFFFFRSNLF